MSRFLPREGTRTLKIVKFIAAHANGVRANEVERFIVTDMGKTWVPSKGAGAWKNSLYGQKGIFSKYCVKVKDHWQVTRDTAYHLQCDLDPDYILRNRGFGHVMLERHKLAKELGLSPFTSRLSDLNESTVQDLTLTSDTDRGVKVTDTTFAPQQKVLAEYIEQQMALDPELIKLIGELKAEQANRQQLVKQRGEIFNELQEANRKLAEIQRRDGEANNKITASLRRIENLGAQIKLQLGVK